MSKEIWKDIPDSDGCKISNYGNVKRKAKQFVDIETTIEGYLRCIVGGSLGREYIHRLVAKAFCQNEDPEKKKYVDHIDGDKQNNRADNLRWVTSQENTKACGEMGKLSKRRGNKTPVIAINIKTHEVAIAESQMDLCRRFVLDDGAVSKVLHDTRITTHDWLIRYLSNENIESLKNDLECI